jgi:hypothetical protein
MRTLLCRFDFVTLEVNAHTTKGDRHAFFLIKGLRIVKKREGQDQVDFSVVVGMLCVMGGTLLGPPTLQP